MLKLEAGATVKTVSAGSDVTFTFDWWEIEIDDELQGHLVKDSGPFLNGNEPNGDTPA